MSTQYAQQAREIRDAIATFSRRAGKGVRFPNELRSLIMKPLAFVLAVFAAGCCDHPAAEEHTFVAYYPPPPCDLTCDYSLLEGVSPDLLCPDERAQFDAFDDCYQAYTETHPGWCTAEPDPPEFYSWVCLKKLMDTKECGAVVLACLETGE